MNLYGTYTENPLPTLPGLSDAQKISEIPVFHFSILFGFTV